MAESIVWPVKQREISGVHNSSLWNGFEFRDDDVIIATPPKTGTTLTQQIVGQLIFGGDPDLFARAVSPWIDAVQMPNAKQMAQAQTHRRFFKTHLPIDTLVYSPMAKYIFVGRDARDVAWALYNNVINLSDFAKDQVRMAENVSYNKDPEIIEYYRNFILGDSFWEHVGGWWSYRHLPNLMVLHFNNLISDRIGSIRQIADFLGIPLSAGLLDKVVEYTSIDHMKTLAAKDKGLEEQFIGGGKTFINKGTNGRWQAVLSEDDIALCDTIAAKRLPPDCAHWLRTGELPNHR
jgi:aryl sulfotransferase